MTAVLATISSFAFACLLMNVSSQQKVKNLDLYEGEVCQKSKGSEPEYVCKRAEHCKSLPKTIKKNQYPDICSFNGSVPIICCPPTMEEVKSLQIVKDKCSHYFEATKMYSKIKRHRSKAGHKEKSRRTKRNDCVTVTLMNDKSKASDKNSKKEVVEEMFVKKNVGSQFVVGGTEAKPMEFPHMALLGYGATANENDWGCGGSLICANWILTAAHCKQIGSKDRLARWARVGDLNIMSVSDDARPKDYRIVEHVLHPDYKPPSVYNDIALFRLETEVEFSDYVKPICLNADPTLNISVQVATGWGRIGTGELTSDDLLKVDLNVIPAEQCNVSYFVKNNPKLEFGILPESMICAGSPDGTRDTCGGDSGGPLQIKNVRHSNMYTQVGITSFGKFCGDKDTPGVYTRVSKYIHWIRCIVWPEIR